MDEQLWKLKEQGNTGLLQGSKFGKKQQLCESGPLERIPYKIEGVRLLEMLKGNPKSCSM